MMAGGGFGAPAPIGGAAPEDDLPPAPPPTAPLAPPASAGNGLDPDQDQDLDASAPMIKPESLHYHDDAQNCQSCQYMAEGGHCSVLQMQVSPDGGCNAFEAISDQGDQNSMGDPDQAMDLGAGSAPGVAAGAGFQQ
jgi:hypothetical protein